MFSSNIFSFDCLARIAWFNSWHSCCKAQVATAETIDTAMNCTKLFLPVAWSLEEAKDFVSEEWGARNFFWCNLHFLAGEAFPCFLPLGIYCVNFLCAFRRRTVDPARLCRCRLCRPLVHPGGQVSRGRYLGTNLAQSRWHILLVGSRGVCADGKSRCLHAQCIFI